MRLGLGIGLNKVKSRGWTPQNIAAKVLFWGKYADISGGEMPNLLGTDALTVAGSVGSETYQCPNTAPYIAADTDYIWFKTDASQRTTTTAELIGYDLQRTPVKYEDESPYELREIIILKADAVLTAPEIDRLHSYMWLSVLWGGTMNAYGHIKANAELQRLWTPESLYDAASEALFTRMAALSESPSAPRRVIIDTAIVADKAKSFWTDKYDAFWLLAAHGNDSALLNILADEYNLQLVSTPAFETDRGYTGNGSSHGLNSLLNLRTGTEKFTQTSCSIGIYIRSAGQSVGWDCGCFDGATAAYLSVRFTDDKNYYTLLGAGYNKANTDASGMWIITRDGGTLIVYKNGVQFDAKSAAPAAIPNEVFKILHGGSANWSARQVALSFIAEHMTAQNVADFQTIWVDGYLNSIGAKV